MTDDNLFCGVWRCAFCFGNVEGQDHSECAEAFLDEQAKKVEKPLDAPADAANVKGSNGGEPK